MYSLPKQSHTDMANIQKITLILSFIALLL